MHTATTPSSAPQATALDSTLALLADPYRYIGRLCAGQGAPAVAGRLLLQPAVFLSGAAAARMFYEAPQLVRQGAAPEPLLATLLGRAGVQTLDGAPHRHRKALFLDLAGAAAVPALRALAAERWGPALAAAARGTGTVALYPVLQEWLFDTALRWAGVPVAAREHRRWRDCTVALFDGAASSLTGHLHARAARRWLQARLAADIDRARSGAGPFAEGSPALAVARHRDTEGRLPPPQVAATELLNLLRPIVAVSVFVVFAAHALALRPGHQAALDRPAGRLAFAQEVRRFYPFFPAVPARVREPFEWQGVAFPRGARVLLDLHGTNHDPAAWPQPERFDPQRFAAGAPDRYLS